LGNVDIRAADVFWSFKDQILSKRPLPHLEQQIQAALLTGLMKYFAQLGLGEDVDADLREEEMNALKGRADWIKFTKPETPAKPTVTAVADPTSAAVAANVIYFDELTGIAQNAQVSFDPLKQKTPGEKAQSTTTTARKLPWREWNSGMGSVMGDAAADKAAAVAVLHSLHARFDVCKEQIDVWQVGSGKRVNATHDAEANAILLPPVVPRQSKVLERSEHPWAQHIEVRVRNCAEDDDGTLMRTATFYMNPEFTPPHAIEGPPAVAAAPPPTPKAPPPAPTSQPLPKIAKMEPPAVAASQGSDEVTLADGTGTAAAAVADEWDWADAVTMPPFWAVRRLTTKELTAQVRATPPGTPPPRFNCGVITQTVTCSTVGVVKDNCVNISRVCSINFLTNIVSVKAGEELIVRADAKPDATPSKKRNWKQVVKDQEHALSLAATAATSKAAAASRTNPTVTTA
jgi:hypothetical protein